MAATVLHDYDMMFLSVTLHQN